MNWTIEQAEEKIENLLYINKAINDENKAMDILVENLKCCANCCHPTDDFECAAEKPMTMLSEYCDKWQSDGQQREDRLIA